MIYLTATG